jgi:hypothetical protein
MYDTQFNGMAGGWDSLHRKVEALRLEGFGVWVIRQPAYKLTPDNLDINFDLKWKSHLLAFGLDDEFEDKQPGGNLFSNLQPILDYVKNRIAEYKNWMSDIPIFANFNGTHIGENLQNNYQQIINLGIDILCQDCYPLAAQQVKPDGTLMYPDIFASATNGTRLFKQWFPNKPCWTFLECCNQDIMHAGQPGWADPWVAVGSRAPTAAELWKFAWFNQQVKGNGLAWFPQSHGGATNDDTDPALIGTMLEIAKHYNVTPVPPPPNPPNPKPPVAKTLVGLDLKYSDGSVQSIKI